MAVISVKSFSYYTNGPSSWPLMSFLYDNNDVIEMHLIVINQDI